MNHLLKLRIPLLSPIKNKLTNCSDFQKYIKPDALPNLFYSQLCRIFVVNEDNFMEKQDIINVTSPLLPDIEEFKTLLEKIWDSRWITNNGTVMETPVIYSGDKVEVGTRGFLGFGFKPLANVALGGSSPIASEYQSIFNGLLEKYK